jgi:hypothetical protein
LEGTALLKYFDVPHLPDIRVIKHKGDSFFIRKFLDGFALTHLDVFEKMKNLYSPVELVDLFAMKLGRLTVQTDLLAKGDFGGENELVTIHEIDGKPEISIMQIDLSSSFSNEKDTDQLGVAVGVYQYYCQKTLDLADQMNLSNSEKQKVLTSFFRGVLTQYSRIRGSYYQQTALNPNLDNIDRHTQRAIFRINNTAQNILDNVHQIFMKANIKDKQLILDAILGKRSELDRILSANLGDKKAMNSDLIRTKFGAIKTQETVEDAYFMLRDLYLDVKDLMVIDWMWGNQKFDQTRNVIGYIHEKQYSVEDITELLMFLYEHLDVVFQTPNLDLRQLLEEMTHK